MLNIKNGIIQDQYIMDIPVKIEIVSPKGKANVRTLKSIEKLIGITNHNTANTSPTAGDEMHADWLQNVENADKKYVGAHLFVDDDSITQVIPLNEKAYHAGDGSNGPGNSKTISIEICENENYAKSEENAIKLNAALLMTYPGIEIFKHEDWSGKNCPRRILNENRWNEFVNRIKKVVKNQLDPWEDLRKSAHNLVDSLINIMKG